MKLFEHLVSLSTVEGDYLAQAENQMEVTRGEMADFLSLFWQNKKGSRRLKKGRDLLRVGHGLAIPKEGGRFSVGCRVAGHSG